MTILRSIIGDSPEMQRVYSLVKQVADTNSTVLVSGASGTGKELVARAIHELSKRRPFVAINCAAISESLIESIMFGHERGSFTGADRMYAGKFEHANGGTLLLDEIGSMKSDLQAKLLRVLQEKEVERIGGKYPIPVDVRVIAASNEPMRQLVADGKFREDLYYRLAVIEIPLPTLAERKQDIPKLVEFLVEKYNKECGRCLQGFSAEAMQILKEYDWPGNVRQLENIVQRSVVIHDGTVQASDLPAEVFSLPIDEGDKNFVGSFKQASESFNRRYITRVLQETEWNQVQAAKRLGMHRNTLANKITELHIREEYEASLQA